MKNEIAIKSSDLPEWTNIGNGDWMKIKELTADDLPTLAVIDRFAEGITTQQNCNEQEALIFGKELTVDGLQTAKDDRRAESPRFGRIITKMFMEYPHAIVDQAIDNLITDLKWLPEPARIREELDKVNRPRTVALARALTLRMRVKHLKPKLSVVPLNAEQREKLKTIQGKMA